MNIATKVICVFLAITSLLSLFAITASAASSQCLFSPENFEIVSCQVSGDNGTSWIAPKSYGFTTNDNGSGCLVVTCPSSISFFTHWRAKFTPLTGAGNLVVQPYMQLNATFYYQHYYYNQDRYAEQTLTGALYLTTPDGSIYEFPITDQQQSADETYYFVTVGGTVEVVEGFEFSQCSVEFVFSGITNVGAVNLDFNNFSLTAKDTIVEDATAKVVTSIEQGFADLQEQQKDNTQDIIDNQNQNMQDIIDNNNANTDKITGSIEDSTDKITNGWETDDNTAGETDSAVGDLGSAEDEALGGKSDEEIQEEINGALSSPSLPAQKLDNVMIVGGTFEKLLNAFGGEYQSLLVLALTLGLAAFLVGRQYSAKGD